MADSKCNFIGRDWVACEDVSENRNPANPDDVIGLFARGRAVEVEAAVPAAKAAASGWAGASPQLRPGVLRRAGELILAQTEALGRLLAREEARLWLRRRARRCGRRNFSTSTPGTVMVNLPAVGANYYVPFGGRGASSLGGREQGRMAMDFYTSVKTAYTYAG